MPQGFVKPTNRILHGPSYVEPTEFEIGANATAAKCVPGRLVIDDTTDGDVKEAGANADNILGVLEVDAGMAITDAYAVGDPCRVITTIGARVVLTLVTGGAAVAPGDPIVSAADGKASKQAVGAMGAQGMVVAHALETQDPSAADKACLCRLALVSEPAAAS